jgi:hypothetical protein
LSASFLLFNNIYKSITLIMQFLIFFPQNSLRKLAHGCRMSIVQVFAGRKGGGWGVGGREEPPNSILFYRHTESSEGTSAVRAPGAWG